MASAPIRSLRLASSDRDQQYLLLDALDAAPSQLGRDECGVWIITGKRGTIQTWGDGSSWVVYVQCSSARHWSATSKRLKKFLQLTQDGDDDGCFRLQELPSRGQAKAIREAVGLGKKREYDPDTFEQLKATAAGLAPARVRAEKDRAAMLVPTDDHDRPAAENPPAAVDVGSE